MAIRWLDGSEGDAIALDDTFFPILVTTWVGPASVSSVDTYFVWLDAMLKRAMQEKTPLVNITDAGLAKNPNAEVRRIIAERTKAWGASGADTHPVTSYVVIESAIIRGTLTVIGWLHGNMKSVNVATCAEALERGIQDLRAAGKPAPTGLIPARWKRPNRLTRTG